MEKQTAGHEQLGEFAPKFAELNDDILLEKSGVVKKNFQHMNVVSLRLLL